MCRKRVVAPRRREKLVTLANVVHQTQRRCGGPVWWTSASAIGTGPFKLVTCVPGERVEFARNDAWSGQKPAWMTLTIRLIPNFAARTAALLSGDLDLIDTTSASDLPRLEKTPAVASVAGMRVNYVVAMVKPAEDAPAVTDKKGLRLDPSPLANAKVREARSLAINRTGIAERILLGTATPTGQWLPAGLLGHDPKTPVPAYDVEMAKALLPSSMPSARRRFWKPTTPSAKPSCCKR